jgi:hypothetical protein
VTRTRPIFVAAGALALILVAVPQAQAQPAGDDFDNATLITALPFTDTVNTFESTVAPDDPQTCFGGFWTNSVWYAFTPTQDMRLDADTFAGGGGHFMAAFTGTRGNLTQVACGQNQLLFDAAANTTVFFMIGQFCCGSPTVFSLNPGLEIDVEAVPIGSVTIAGGVATIEVDIACNRVPDNAFVGASLRQKAGRFNVITGSVGFAVQPQQCDPDGTRVSGVVVPESGAFFPGPAEVTANAFAIFGNEIATDEDIGTVRLRPTVAA